MSSKSLGPFPKTRRWSEIAAKALSGIDPDLLLEKILSELQRLIKDADAIRATSNLVAHVVETRKSKIPPTYSSETNAGRALRETLATWERRATTPETLFSSDPLEPWRHADGPPFCDLARLFFKNLIIELLRDLALANESRLEEEDAERFAREMSLITRSFSARWFNACARYENPEPGSIAWYLGHCLGKLELEFSRELSTWVEPTGNPWKRLKRREPALQLEH